MGIRSRKAFSSLGILLLSAVVAVGCTSKGAGESEATGTNSASPNASEAAASAQPGGTIRIGIMEEADTLDIHKSVMNLASQIGIQIGGSLLSLNPATNELEPYLADSYTVSEDGKTLTFKIREGVAFHDGTPLTAKSFKDTFERIMNPETGATTAASFIRGVKSVSAPDDRTLIIEMETPSATLLTNLTDMPFLQPLSMSAIEAAGADYGRNPVGVGPWKFDKWVPGQSILLSRNDAYNWGPSFYERKGKVYPDQVEYKFFTDMQTMMAALDTGSIDIAYKVDTSDAKRYRDNPNYTLVEADMQGLGLFIEMNLENDTLKDVQVRKAINKAINKDAIIQAVLNGEGSPAYGPLPSTIFGYDPEVEKYGYSYDANGAAQMLESSGWKKNSGGIMEKDGKPLQLELAITNQDSQAAQMVQAMLKEIGIELKIQVWDQATLLQKVSQGEYNMTFLIYGYNDPDILYNFFHSSQIGGLNHVRVRNSDLDKLLAEGGATLDQEKRKQIYAKIQNIIVDEAYWAPIYVPKVIHIANNKIQNVKLQKSTLLLDLYDSWVKPK